MVMARLMSLSQKPMGEIMLLDETKTYLVYYLVDGIPVKQRVFPGYFSVEKNLNTIDELIDNMREEYCEEFSLNIDEIRLKDGSQLKRIK